MQLEKTPEDLERCLQPTLNYLDPWSDSVDGSVYLRISASCRFCRNDCDCSSEVVELLILFIIYENVPIKKFLSSYRPAEGIVSGKYKEYCGVYEVGKMSGRCLSCLVMLTLKHFSFLD